jgi:uncharacterized lipoprotein YmbA
MVSLLPLSIILLLLTACGSTPESHFYILTPIEQAGVHLTWTADTQKHIGIGPVRLPEYLDRPQIVTRTASSEVLLSDIHRWAEPLQENFTRVLAENLSHLLGTDQVSIEPSASRFLVDYRITVDVTQFDAGTGSNVILIAYWNIYGQDGSSLTGMNKSQISLTAGQPSDPAATVTALSTALAGLSREIAAALTNLPASGPE